MVLAVLALSAVPAFGQARGDDVQYNAVCQNIIGQIGDINANNTANQSVATDGGEGGEGGNAGDGGTGGAGAAGGNAEALARIAQETGVSIEQVNECLNAAGNGGGEDEEEAEVNSANTAAARQYGVIAKTIPQTKALVNTGGPSLIGLAVISLAISVVGISVLTGGLRR